MNERNFAQNNSTIISASPYRAVIRRKEYSEYDHQEETQRSNTPRSIEGQEYGLDDEMDQFDRDIGNTLGGERFKDTYTTGRQYDNVNEFFPGDMNQPLNTVQTRAGDGDDNKTHTKS